MRSKSTDSECLQNCGSSLLWSNSWASVGGKRPFDPNIIVYEITENWKSNASDGPSDHFKLYTRIEGAFVCLVSIAAIIVTLVTA